LKRDLEIAAIKTEWDGRDVQLLDVLVLGYKLLDFFVAKNKSVMMR